MKGQEVPGGSENINGDGFRSRESLTVYRPQHKKTIVLSWNVRYCVFVHPANREHGSHDA